MSESSTPRVDRSLVQALILAAGLAVAGLFVGVGFERGRSADRSVTVKGVAERDVKADLAIWPLSLVVADNDLARAQGRMQTDLDKVRAFLVRNGLDTAATALQNYSVSDAATNQYNRNESPNSRFVIRQTLIVRSQNPPAVLAASQRIGELVANGVVLSSGGEGSFGGPTFVFTGLNALKPAMIGEATARAREAADQFARDAHSRIGGIRTANQGIFEILPRDQAQGITEESQVMKKVRVVTTIEYSIGG